MEVHVNQNIDTKPPYTTESITLLIDERDDSQINTIENRADHVVG